MAWQIFDAKVTHLLEPRYATSTPHTAASIGELIGKLELAGGETALRTIEEYNAAAGGAGVHFDPGDRDGLATRGGLKPAKSNWAQKIDTPPYTAWPVTGGITFSFGGLKVNERAEVMGTDWWPIAGL